jgi:4-hydroxybenzoate polyprenyltransferase
MSSRLGIFLAKHWRNTVYSNVWIAIGAAAFCFQGELLIDASSGGILPLFVFFATVFLYNFQRAVKLFHKPSYSIPGRNTWLVKNRKAIGLWSIVGGLAMLVIAFTLPLRDWIVLSIGGIVSILYVTKIGRRGGKSLAIRELPFIKIFLIAFSWVITGVVFPWVHHGYWSVFESKEILWVALEKLCFIVAITIPFDIRDLQYDDSKMKTLPQLLGIKGSLWLSRILIVSAALFCVVGGFYEVYSPAAVAALLGCYVFIGGTFEYARIKRDELYYTGWLDSTILVQSLAVIATYFWL